MPYLPDHLTTLYPPCFYCKHLVTTGSQQPDLHGWTCTAFPVEIPYDILMRYSKHTEPDIGQVGDDVFESDHVELEGTPGMPAGKYRITFDGDWLPVK